MPRSTVNLFAVADGQNQNEQDWVVNFVNDPVVSDTEAITILKSAHFLRADAPGIFRQFVECVVESLLPFRVPDFSQRLLDRRTDFQPITAHVHPSRLRASGHGMFSPGSSRARFAAPLSPRSSSRRNCSSTN